MSDPDGVATENRNAGDTPFTTSPASEASEPGLFYFRGRIGRKAYWARLITASVLLVGVLLVNVYLLGEGALAGLVTLAALLVWAALSVATCVKRWHDLNRPGWLTLLCLTGVFIPVALIWQGFTKGTAGPNAYGSDPGK